MLVLMFTEVQNLHVPFLCAYANVIIYVHTQTSEKQWGHIVLCTRVYSPTGWVKSVPKSYPNSYNLGMVCVFGMKKILEQKYLARS